MLHVYAKYLSPSYCGSEEEDFLRKSLRTHARTHGRRTTHDHKSSPCHYVTGELKTCYEFSGQVKGQYQDCMCIRAAVRSNFVYSQR